MFIAGNAASSVMELLQSLTSSKSSSMYDRESSDPFDIFGGTAMYEKSTAASGLDLFPQMSPATMNALLAAQRQTSTASPLLAAAGKPDVPKDLFAQLDADGDGQITKLEFEATAASAATSSYNLMEQMIARQMQAFASSSTAWMSL